MITSSLSPTPIPNATVTIVIPIYKPEPSELEKISLAQTLAVLSKHPITFMAPTDLDTSWYEKYCAGKAQVFVERFAWQGWQAYSDLMMSPAFYQRFLAYDYMLICQLDAFVFRDELARWCALGYDYIGAVIYNQGYDKPKTFLRSLFGYNFPDYVGAGGFCLKRNSSFYRMTTKYKRYTDLIIWFNQVRKRIFLDDIFIALHYPKLDSSFKIAPKELAQQFGADYNNGDAAKLPFTNRDNKTMPFGVHAWIQYQPEYWKPVIRRFGYAL